MDLTISVVRAFNGEDQQIRKYGEKLDDVQKACNTAAVKIGMAKGARVEAEEWQGSEVRERFRLTHQAGRDECVS